MQLKNQKLYCCQCGEICQNVMPEEIRSISFVCSNCESLNEIHFDGLRYIAYSYKKFNVQSYKKNMREIWKLEELCKHSSELQKYINGDWVAARPIKYVSFFKRIKIVWLVFKGKLDVFQWPGGQ